VQRTTVAGRAVERRMAGSLAGRPGEQGLAVSKRGARELEFRHVRDSRWWGIRAGDPGDCGSDHGNDRTRQASEGRNANGGDEMHRVHPRTYAGVLRPWVVE